MCVGGSAGPPRHDSSGPPRPSRGPVTRRPARLPDDTDGGRLGCRVAPMTRMDDRNDSDGRRMTRTRNSRVGVESVEFGNWECGVEFVMSVGGYYLGKEDGEGEGI